jgi:CheY-like chemotaxis protein
VPDPPTLLVVEDDPHIRLLVVELLLDAGYQVEEAQDGTEAVQTLDRHSAAPGGLGGVLLDMMLPGVNGLGVLRRFQELGFTAPVLAMSASTDMLAAARSEGAHATVAKPFDLPQLLDLVAEHFQH